MEMQSKRKRKHKRKHKHKHNSSVTSDKHTIIKRLQNLNFCLDRILRAIKVYEHNYGKKYDFNLLTEIVVRLKKKDLLKYEDPSSTRSKEEEKRNTTKYFTDDVKHNANIRRGNSNSLSLSICNSANVTPISLNDYYSFDNQTQLQNTQKPKKKPQLLRRHTDNDKLILHEDYQHGNINNNIHKQFIKCMNLSEAETLKIFDTIDHRDFVGKFCIATIIEIDKYNPYNVKIHYDGYNDNKYDVWSNYKNELFRFAKYRSISRRFQNKNEYINGDKNKIYKRDISIGKFIFLNPIHTIYGNKWYKGIINKFDKKSDQIQIAYQPNINNNDYILHWTHIDNICEIKLFNSNNNNIMSPFEHKQKHKHIQKHNQKQKQIINKEAVNTKKRDNFSEWSTKQVIEWLNKIENGKFNDEIFDHFRQQCEIIQLKGYELTTLNETALKFAGLLNQYDRKLIINNILHLVNENHNINNTTKINTEINTTINTKINTQVNNNLNINKEIKYEYSLDGNETIDADLNLKLKKNKYNKNIDGGRNNNIKQLKQNKDCRVLNEVMDLWKQ